MQEDGGGGFQCGGFMLYWLQDFRADESCFIEEENRGVYNVIFLWEALEMKLRTNTRSSVSGGDVSYCLFYNCGNAYVCI